MTNIDLDQETHDIIEALQGEVDWNITKKDVASKAIEQYAERNGVNVEEL